MAVHVQPHPVCLLGLWQLLAVSTTQCLVCAKVFVHLQMAPSHVLHESGQYAGQCYLPYTGHVHSTQGMCTVHKTCADVSGHVQMH
jgi:hypothetical protein